MHKKSKDIMDLSLTRDIQANTYIHIFNTYQLAKGKKGKKEKGPLLFIYLFIYLFTS